eukprot:TRINITY_DN18916_c0_g1_i1.p1 TRINITY_DN18916_c0_g1~~TRINITY_DN18916_c0_g1_i1.p1  ORF type:complete len:252 (-),score=48.27 TRINITY_DN18916_c0_g1_i1:201-956(-)
MATTSYEQMGTSAKEDSKFVDLESGDMLYPGIEDNEMRWGFIRKVYGILSAQLLFTSVVVAVIILNAPVRGFVMTSQPFIWVSLLLPFVTMIPLYIYRHRHPHNLGILALWTFSLSLMVGTTCTFYSGALVLEALVLTGAVVLGLTAYTFYAVKKGADFGYLGPMLFSSLMVLIMWGFIQIFFAPGPIGYFIYSLVGALLFSLYIVYDTDNLIKRYSYDEYVWASVGLYLDIINLFLRLLQILRSLQGGDN